MRISDVNALRKLRYGQAIMLGIEITADRYGPALWHFSLPPYLQPHGRGWTSGYYRRRWECVEAALRTIDLNPSTAHASVPLPDGAMVPDGSLPPR